MMMSGVISGAILSWIMIITELSTSIILYTSKDQDDDAGNLFPRSSAATTAWLPPFPPS